MPDEKKGVLLVIEGVDGSGKATQAKMLVDKLNSEGRKTTMISFPRYNTPTGQIVGQCYLGKDLWGEDKAWFGEPDKVEPLIASLYYAADRRAAKQEIEELLASGTNVVSDRYYHSNMTHQGGKIRDRTARRAFFNKIYRLELEILGIPKEDRLIFLHMPWQVAQELRERRTSGTDGHENNQEHLRRAEEVYVQIANRNHYAAIIECAPDGTRSSLKTPEEINQEVYKAAIETINWVNGTANLPHRSYR